MAAFLKVDLIQKELFKDGDAGELLKTVVNIRSIERTKSILLQWIGKKYFHL